MKDRVPTYPGRVKLTPVEGQENTYDMTRADQPAQAGTPLNKATLLKDETAEKLGLDPADDPTVDDALNGLAVRDVKNNFKVGDTLTTVRTDLGDKWLLCNGENLSAESYPELSQLFKGEYLSNINNVGPEGNSCVDVIHDEGVYAVLKADTATGVVKLLTSSNLESTVWAEKELWNSQSSSHFYYYPYLMKIQKINNYYVVNGSRYDGAKYYGCIAYATSLTGEWTVVDICETSYDNRATGISDFKYLNGYYVAVGGRMSNSTKFQSSVWYSTSLAGGYTQVVLNQSNRATIYSGKIFGPNSVSYINGQYIVCGSIANGDNRNTAKIWYSSTLNGTWSDYSVWTSSSTSGYGGYETCAFNILYYAGYYYVTGVDSSNARGVRSTALNSGWVDYNVVGYNPVIISGYVYSMRPTYIYVSEVTETEILPYDSTKRTRILGSGGVQIKENGQEIIIPDQIYGASNTKAINVSPKSFTLPTISLDSTYTYIKAKE